MYSTLVTSTSFSKVRGCVTSWRQVAFSMGCESMGFGDLGYFSDSKLPLAELCIITTLMKDSTTASSFCRSGLHANAVRHLPESNRQNTKSSGRTCATIEGLWSGVLTQDVYTAHVPQQEACSQLQQRAREACNTIWPGLGRLATQ